MAASPTLAPLLVWYERHARPLPWRDPAVSPWAVLVSEVMLQQTPVRRVLPAYDAWIRRWPTPAALAADAPGEAVRMWGRLGYPRRALRLHAVAEQVSQNHGGELPATQAELRALPGVGEYTAAAVSAFAFRRRVVVLDTNVRRVLARLVRGVELPPRQLGNAERAAAAEVLPPDPETAARWNVALMELGALVCTARAPACGRCPVSSFCAWRAAGAPRLGEPVRRSQSYSGTDRECRGQLLAVLRDSAEPVAAAAVEASWDDAEQRLRALQSLVDDGLVVRRGGLLALP